MTVLKHFVKGGDTKFYRYPREPECQRRWMLTGMRHDWGSNRACNNHFLKELSAHNCSGSTCKRPVVSRIAVGLKKHPKKPT